MFSRNSKNSGDARDGGLSVIAAGCSIVGSIESKGEIQLDGTLKGDIKGDKIVVGEHGSIEGTISGDIVRILGTVNGQIQARAVELLKTANVRGDILHDSLSVATGAVVEGRFNRLNSPESEIKALISPAPVPTPAPEQKDKENKKAS